MAIYIKIDLRADSFVASHCWAGTWSCTSTPSTRVGTGLNPLRRATLKKAKVRTKQPTIYSLFLVEEKPRAKSCSPNAEVKGASPVNGEREDWELETAKYP